MQWVRKKKINSCFISIYLSSFYRLPDRTKINLNRQRMISSAENTKQYSNDYHYDATRLQHVYEKPAEIFVINGDCLDTVQYLKKKYPTCNPVVLNMANANCPGGGWRNGLYFCFVYFNHTNLFIFIQVVELKKRIYIAVQIYFNVLKILIIS